MFWSRLGLRKFEKIIISIFFNFSAQARLRLLEKLEIIDAVIGPHGGKSCYVDTDSIHVKCPRGMKEILFEALGVDDFLGCLKNELPDHEILELYIGGSKAYAMKVWNFISNFLIF